MKKLVMCFVFGLFLICLVSAPWDNATGDCTENWNCSDWSDCIDGVKTRTCEDLSVCNITKNKPILARDCDVAKLCSSEGEMCGGIAGLLCCGGLKCKMDDVNNHTTDASGICVKDDDDSDKVCCHKFGYGSQMVKVNSQYQYIEREDCVTPENFVGGGREIVADSFCEQNRVRERLKRYYGNITECPDSCTCSGSVMKCSGPNGRIMTVYAGGSGNVIVQIKEINMSTRVELYKENGTLFGVFKGNKTREIKIMPDQVQEKIRERIQARLENYNITLDEDGTYLVKVGKKARLCLIIPVNENGDAEVDSESGEIIRIRKSWWGFLARDVRE